MGKTWINSPTKTVTAAYFQYYSDSRNSNNLLLTLTTSLTITTFSSFYARNSVYLFIGAGMGGGWMLLCLLSETRNQRGAVFWIILNYAFRNFVTRCKLNLLLEETLPALERQTMKLFVLASGCADAAGAAGSAGCSDSSEFMQQRTTEGPRVSPAAAGCASCHAVISFCGRHIIWYAAWQLHLLLLLINSPDRCSRALPARHHGRSTFICYSDMHGINWRCGLMKCPRD